MNPLNPYHWLALAAIVGALIFGVHRLDVSRQAIGYDRAKAEYTTAALKSEQAARAKEQTLQSQLKKAQDDAKLRETKLAADAGRARAAVAGLRDDLAATRSQLSTLARDAVNQYAATSTELLNQCGASLADMARAADGHANDSLMLQEAWPK